MTGRVARLVAAVGTGAVLSGALAVTAAHAAPPVNNGTAVQEHLAMVIFNGSDKADATHKTIPVMGHELDGVVAYCVDWNDSVKSGNVYHQATADEKVAPPQLDTVTAILSNGFGANTAAEVLAAAGVTDLGGVSGADLDKAAFTGTQAAICTPRSRPSSASAFRRARTTSRSSGSARTSRTSRPSRRASGTPATGSPRSS